MPRPILLPTIAQFRMHRMAPKNPAAKKRVVSVRDNAMTHDDRPVLAQPTVFREPGRTATHPTAVAIVFSTTYVPRGPQLIAVYPLSARPAFSAQIGRKEPVCSLSSWFA